MRTGWLPSERPEPPSRWERVFFLFGLGLLLGFSGVFASDPIPAFRLEGLRGGELTERDVARGRHFLILWASWSPRCRTVLEQAQELSQRQGDRARVLLVAFQESRQEVEQFLAGRKEPAPIFLDGDGSFARAFRIATLPGLVVLVEGEVRYQGRLPEDLSSLDTLRYESVRLDRRPEGQTPAPPEVVGSGSLRRMLFLHSW